MLVVGILAGWTGSRFYAPIPTQVLLSPRVQCGGVHEVGVPMLENAAWAVKAGKLYWSARDGRWVGSTQWISRPGALVVAPAPEGVQIAVKGMRDANVSGSYIRAVKLPEKADKSPKKENKS